MTDQVLYCSRRLALKPAGDGWDILNKSDWSPVGRMTVDGAGTLSWLQIQPPARRQGLASEAFFCLLREQPECIPARAEGPPRWLRHLGFQSREQQMIWVGHGNPPDEPERAADADRHLEQQLGVPADYASSHALPRYDEPRRLLECGMDVFDRPLYLEPATARRWRQMARVAAADSIELQPVSGFRSYGYQAALIRRKLDAGQSPDEIFAVNVAPGYSEHHSGRALDLSCPGYAPLELQFARSAAFDWLTKRADEFGFRLSYPEHNRHGLQYEPWHWAYI